MPHRLTRSSWNAFLSAKQLCRLSVCSHNVNRRHNATSATSLSGKTVRIGCASGFWGDTAVSAPQLIHGGNLDFLVFDYLSEITMSLLTAARRKSEDQGYAPDFVQVAMAPYIKDIKKKGVKVISNAGGVNPLSCAAALKEVCNKANTDLNIAVVTGDDLMPQMKRLQEAGVKEMYSGAMMPATVNSMTAYLGAGPISRALDLGADIVVTGRCVDSALVLAPLFHKLKWNPDDFDKLSAGSLAGHLVECGAQVTGGIFTDWHKVPDWSNIGFPIVECSSDGDFIVTKPPKTGGLVSTATVSEQLLYEIGDPSQYILPDVVCDFTDVKLTEMEVSEQLLYEIGDPSQYILPDVVCDYTGVKLTDIEGKSGESVLVTGAKGKPPTSDYKVSATYSDGYRVTAVACVGGPRSKDKALRTAEEILKRCRNIFKMLKMEDFSNVNIEVLGSEHNYGPMSRLPQGGREAVLWLAAHHKDKNALGILSREIAPAGTGMAPGLTGIVGGRPRVSPVLKLFSFLQPKDSMKIDIHMNGEWVETYTPPTVPTEKLGASQRDYVDTAETLPRGTNTYRLEDLAYTRSGDKGNHANIGVVARHPAILPYLKQALTEDAVQKYFAHLMDGETGPTGKSVQRFDVPGISAMNFMLYNSLGGGGIASLRSDPQGKAYGQMLLDFEISNMPDISELTEGR